jgi:hypothetical protein
LDTFDQVPLTVTSKKLAAMVEKPSIPGWEWQIKNAILNNDLTKIKQYLGKNGGKNNHEWLFKFITDEKILKKIKKETIYFILDWFILNYPDVHYRRIYKNLEENLIKLLKEKNSESQIDEKFKEDIHEFLHKYDPTEYLWYTYTENYNHLDDIKEQIKSKNIKISNKIKKYMSKILMISDIISDLKDKADEYSSSFGSKLRLQQDLVVIKNFRSLIDLFFNY